MYRLPVKSVKKKLLHIRINNRIKAHETKLNKPLHTVNYKRISHSKLKSHSHRKEKLLIKL